MNAAYPYIGAVVIALALSYVGPSPKEATDAYEDAISAQQAAQQRARFEQRAQQMCGENAAWVELPDGQTQCKTKHGRNTIKVTL